MPSSRSSLALRDVALACGVSVGTVSMALRNHRAVAPETRARIQAEAERLGYRPNPVVASLASKHFRLERARLGTPLAFMTCGEWSAVPWGLPPAEAAARHLGYDMRHVEMREQNASVPEVLDRLYAQGVAGILLATWDERQPAWEGDWSRFAVVGMHGYWTKCPFHTVQSRAFDQVRMIWDRMIARGYRRIGAALCAHGIPLEDDDLRYAAVRLCQDRTIKNGEDRIPPFLGGHADQPSVIAWMKQHRPDAVIGFATSHYFAVQDAGYRVPEDIGFCSLHVKPDNVEVPEERNFSGTMERMDIVAQTAVEYIDQLIRHGQLGIPDYAREILVPVSWWEGNTLPDRTGQTAI